MISFSSRMDAITGSAIREIFKYLATPGMISLAGGNPSPDTFPSADVAEITASLMSRAGGAVLQYGATDGYLPLRESVLEFVKGKGIEASLENVLILSGSSQGLELATKCLLNDGDVILTEGPTFLGALQTFRTYRAEPVVVKMDEFGMDMEDLEAKIRATHAKVIYTIPTFQNPTGRTMPAERRARMLELAEKYNVMILEDDPYGDLRYSGEPQPTIKSMDKNGHVIYLGSFSKTFSPGLRVGYAVGDAGILRKMTIGKQGADCHTSNLSQAIIDEYMRAGKFLPHIQECCDYYAVKRDAMVEAIKKYFPASARYTIPEGGLFMWVALDEDKKAMDLFQKAIDQKVAFVPGVHFYPGLDVHNDLRLNFSMVSVDMIDEGVKRLGALIAEL